MITISDSIATIKLIDGSKVYNIPKEGLTLESFGTSIIFTDRFDKVYSYNYAAFSNGFASAEDARIYLEGLLDYTPSVSVVSQNGVDANNSTATPLTGGATWVGTATDVAQYPAIVFSCKTDVAGTLYAEFSTDGTNWDSSLTYIVDENFNEVHRLKVSKRYFRLRYVNGSSAQSYFRLQALFSNDGVLTSALNSTIFPDADATVTRPLDFNLMVAEGLYYNRTNTIKDGFNIDIDSTSVPEDITNEGGIYAGFPTGTPQAGEIVVSGADTGTVFYFYLASPTDLDYTFGSKAITGAGTYALGHNVWRSNFMYFIASSPTSTNVGDITLRNNPTTTNVFCVIPAGYGQSYCSAYTVPFGNSVYLDRITGSLRGSTSGSLDGAFYYRDSVNGGYRLRFPFELQYGGLYFDDIDYLIRIPAGVDIIPRITSASTNNLQAKISYRIIKVR